MKPRTYVPSLPLIGVLTAALLAGCASDPDQDGCDISSMGTGEGSINLAAAFVPSRLDAGSLVTSADGKQLLASCTEGICRWNAGGGAFEVVADSGYRAINPDLSLVARKVGCSDIALVEVDSGEQVQRLEGLPNPKVTDASPVGEIAFSPDGDLVAGAGLEGDVVIWATEDGDEVASTDVGNGVGSISFSPDGSLVAVATGDLVKVLEADSGDEVGTITEADGARPVWSPDGRWIAGAAADGSAAIWDAKTFETAETAQVRPVAAVAFAPDSGSLALTGRDDTSLASWAPDVLGGNGEVTKISQTVPAGSNALFSPDGTILYTASAEEGVAAWDVRTGKATAQFDQPPMS